MQMDPPMHTEKRKNVTAVVAPKSLAQMESLIRERAGKVLDALPRNEELDWVQKVPIELTSMMLATRSEEHTSELQSLMRISYAVFCLIKEQNTTESKTT